MRSLEVSETLGEVASLWWDIWRRLPRPYVFYSPLFLQAWREELAPHTHLIMLVARKEGQVVGIAPLMAQGDELSLAGDPQVCDYMDVVLAPGAEEEALSLMLDRALQMPWRRLVLWGLHPQSVTRSLIPSLASTRGLRVQEEVEAVCPQMALPSSWHEYLRELPSKERHELERKLRRLQRVAEPEMESLSSPEAMEAALDDFFLLHRASRPDKALFMTEAMARFFRRLVSAPEAMARLYFLRLGRERVASVLCFAAGQSLLVYNSGYNPDYSHLAVGLLSKALLVAQAMAEGFRHLDFLRGDEPYKYALGARDWPVYRLVLERP